MVTYRCNDKNCRAKWTDTDGNNVCPSCQSGVGQVEMPRQAQRHTDAAESQELPALPSEQAYMRFICRKYLDAIDGFVHSLPKGESSSAVKMFGDHKVDVQFFEKQLEQMGLPLEQPLGESDAKKAAVIETNLRGAETHLQAAHDMFLEMFSSEEAVDAVEKRFR